MAVHGGLRAVLCGHPVRLHALAGELDRMGAARARRHADRRASAETSRPVAGRRGAEAADRAADGPARPDARHTRLSRRQTDRSEEHTSELKSLMHNLYTVFRLTKK